MIIFGTFLAPPLDFEELLRRSGKPAAYLITCQCFGLLPDAEIRELGAVFSGAQKRPRQGVGKKKTLKERARIIHEPHDTP